MAEEKKSNDGKGKGGCFGSCLGCLVVIALIFSFLLGLYVVPKLRENNWSFSKSFPIFSNIDDMRNRLSNKINDWNYKYIRAKATIEKSTEKVRDTAADVKNKSQVIIDNVTDNSVIPGTTDNSDLMPTLIEE